MKSIKICSPFQTKFEIKTDCNQLIHLLELKHGKYIKRNYPCHAKSIIATKENDMYSIEYSNKIIKNQSGISAIDEIIFNNTVYDENIFAIHGAAVEWNKKAYLFLASTMSGKTTLTSYLTQNGFGYITDDCILLDRTTFDIFPYNTPIHLRDGGIDVLKKLNSAPCEYEILDDGYAKRYVYTPLNCIETPLPLEQIFFINRTNNENSIINLDTTSRISYLLHSPITVYDVTPEYLKFISMLSKFSCCKINYCDMSFVSEVIKNGQQFNE